MYLVLGEEGGGEVREGKLPDFLCRVKTPLPQGRTSAKLLGGGKDPQKSKNSFFANF